MYNIQSLKLGNEHYDNYKIDTDGNVYKVYKSLIKVLMAII